MKAIVSLLVVCTILLVAVDAARITTERKRGGQRLTRAGAGANALCLTFDDGPFSVTADILRELKTLGVKATFFLNCHADASGTAAIVKSMVADGHVLANHMCSHSTMTVEDYAAKYNAHKRDPKTGGQCLKTDAQKKLFRENVQKTITEYQDVAKKANFKLPERSFGLHRYPGDGRFMPCLVTKLNEFTWTGLGASTKHLSHVGWTYEIAPAKTFKHVVHPCGVDGLMAGEARAPVGGDIVLAHDLHYDGSAKLQLLVKWIKKQLAAGFQFALPDTSGVCPKKV